ncbi:GDP-L-fucose synthase family protein [Candidatus Pelagibacter sp. HIMB1521]|uniref:GDP-L-fucose synthase family protein n=1 Tax=Candidatus Pelagibacter sp. HIMB1521 TaxID=3413344 RepID=UPI003F8244EA
MDKNSKIFLAGSSGLVGSAIYKRLKYFGYKNIITSKKKNLNFLNQKKTEIFLQKQKPDYVIVASAKVGGIVSNNSFPANFIYENLAIEKNIIHGSYLAGVKNLLFLGSSCVYPKKSKQPIKEEYLLKGELEKTNEAYAVAKIIGIKMCEYYSKQYKLNYFTIMPCNVFGPNDNYNPLSSHFLPALIKKIHFAKIKRNKQIKLWGSGKPLREVIFSEDLADICIFLLKKKHGMNLINVGSNIELSITNFAKEIMKILNYKCAIKYDKSKPDGVKRKKLDTSLIKKLGWKKKYYFSKNILKTYESFLETYKINV